MLYGVLSEPYDIFRLENHKAVIIGSIYDDGFALILDGKNFVIGELHKYTNFKNVIENMDEVEHYYPDKEDIDSLYLRREVDVTYIDNGIPKKQRAHAYVYNGDMV
jgi:hypothetical protein